MNQAEIDDKYKAPKPEAPSEESRLIDPAVAHTPIYLALEDAHFMAEHHQLDLLVEPSSA